MLQSLTHLLFPQLCAVCEHPLLTGEQHICSACYALLPFTGMRLEKNQVSDKFIGRVPVVLAHALLYYEHHNIVQQVLHRIKYNNKQKFAIFMGEVWGNSLKQTSVNLDFDMIVPVPLAAKKQYKRGYNQSFLIAKGLSNILDIPVNTDVIRRIVNTESQTQKTRPERVKNVESAFEVSKINTQGKHLLLIDDVITTGATLDICANTILRHYPDTMISIGSLALKI